MSVPVIEIGRMLMGMSQSFMLMLVHVRDLQITRKIIMAVVVVPVMMRMPMGVHHRFVIVIVLMIIL
jgi:hypothetical protein